MAALAGFEALGQPYDAARSMQALAFIGRGAGTDGAAAAGDDLERRAQRLYRRVGAASDPDRLAVSLA
jgi:hypothetical protein